MCQGSDGSPVNLIDNETCDEILQGLRGADGSLPTFDSEPGTPPPALEAKAACDRGTQTSPSPTHDQQVQTQPTWTRGNVSQVPHVLTSDGATSTGPKATTSEMGTAMPPRSTTTAWTQVRRVIQKDCGTDMPPVQTKAAESQAGCYSDNEIIPPGAPRPKLPWAYTYAQFDQLLQAYPEVHPEDFVTFGILQEQPRRGSCREWGEVAGALSHMIGGRRTLVNELSLIIHRIQHLDRDDPMRATEEIALVDVILRERRRSAVLLGDGAFAQLAAPGGPMAPPVQ